MLRFATTSRAVLSRTKASSNVFQTATTTTNGINYNTSISQSLARTQKPAHFSNSIQTNNGLNKTVQRILVAQKAVTGVKTPLKNAAQTAEEVHAGRRNRHNNNPPPKTTAADILTLMSQAILIATAAGFAYALVFPKELAAKVEEYKQNLTQRRHDSMLEFMASDRDYASGDLTSVFGDANSNSGSFKQSLMFADQVYHDEVAEDARKMLFQPPILRYGIVTGPAGSGKSRLIRTLAREQPYYAFLSFGLTSSSKSIVDELSEEIGYDFDDWTERLLQGYFFKQTAPVYLSQHDKLSFLLDEFEEACWNLKFDGATGKEGKRPVIVFDDMDSLDLTDKEISKSVRMLFNAANKWAREDTALVVFTCSETLLETLVTEKIVRPDVVSTAQVFHVGDLCDESATRFLKDRLGLTQNGVPPTPLSDNLLYDIGAIKATVGTKIFDLLRVTEELAKKESKSTTPDQTLHSYLSQVLEREVSTAQDTIAHEISAVSELIGPKKMNALLPFLDRLSTLNLKDKKINQEGSVRENGFNFHDALAGGGGANGTSKVWEDARRAGLDQAMRVLREKEVLGTNGLFVSDLVRNGYRRYRHLPPILYNANAKKSSWWWF
ncbi:hypothetical protein BCR33DRAFT_713659 [Rhizoclosmatium globosum]|uniref:ORC1/DEAH AAA+ ATPase domain-containing protein n=1 Tax=Rhizoclosmatium globosum TaxID=329046 RepID=A0A1Y2CUU5_9FUNG|nr:hypothetical protein BCR33DRAFT_713659 [Rhizoclosmatium globosum]|eukprot:ORY50085.1 hypothetical protein BCR33DRAFT_713659 [Rhizoclosmatium globosum]